jgi:hypothetical protein
MLSAASFDFSNIETLGSWKDGFIVAYVTATVGVLIGVYLERDDFPKDIQEYGWSVLVKSLAVELFCGSMVFAIDGRISHIQRDEIIALEKKLAPRVLTDAQQAALIATAARSAPQQYTLSVAVGSESAALLCVIDANLRKAGWIRHEPTDFLHTKPCDDEGWEVGVNLASAVHIRCAKGASDSVRNAIGTLASALMADDIEAHAETDPNMKDPTIIAVLIGAKL